MSDTITLHTASGRRVTFITCAECGCLVSYYGEHVCVGGR